jgi:DNA-binding GntR family transcriptional regulator
MTRQNALPRVPTSSMACLDMYDYTVSGRDSTEAAYLQLRRAILRNELPAGERFAQRELEERFQIGRTPLREALRMLQREGLVEAEPNHRIRVTTFSFPDLEQLYALRISVETLAIRLSVPCFEAEDLARLEDLFAQMAEPQMVGAYERWEVFHRAFHLALIAHAGERIVKMASQLSDHAERYRRFYSTETPRAYERGMREHRAILDACQARDPGAAAEQLARHYSSVVLGILAVLAPEYDPLLVRTALQAVIQARRSGSKSRSSAL